jgi:hypothetical protein
MSNDAAGTKRALLIGIDAYERIKPLDGCVNDVHLMRDILAGGFGFSLENMTMLVNGEATRDGILTALDQFVDSVGDDDLVVIHYAGHGSQMTDREGDEPSGLDSTIMPVDSEGWQGDNRDITDDEIHLRLQRLGAKTSYTTLIFDCCHSGTITRDSFGAKSRSMPADRRPVHELPPSPIPKELWGGARGQARGPSGWMPLGEKYVLISGCRDEELSYEHRPPDLGGKVAHGALTYFLTQELRRATPGTTYRDVYERAAAQVSGANSKQHPQMEGKADREIFGVRDIEPMRHVRVSSRKGNTVTLAAGAALGMTAGSTYAVHAQGTKNPDTAETLGTLTITAVRATGSDGRIDTESAAGAIVEGAYAFETEHAYGELRFPVEVAVSAQHAEDTAALRATLEQEPILNVVEAGAPASVRVYRIEPRESITDGDAVPQLGAVREAVWAVVGETGELVMPLQAVKDGEAVRDNLRTLARYRQSLALDNPDAKSALRGKFTIELLRQTPNGEWVVAVPAAESGQIVFAEGEHIAFRVTSTHDKPVYASLLDFGLAGAVSLVHPEAGAQEKLRENGWFTVGTRDEFDALGLPDTFPFAGDPIHGAPAEGLETVKLIVTENPADFGFLNQEGFEGGITTRSADAGTESPLEMLFRSAAAGPATRDIGRRKTKLEDWTTVVKPFILRRRQTAELGEDGDTTELGGMTLVAPGLTGKVQVHEGGNREKSAQLQAGALFGALDEAGIEVRGTVEIANAQEVAPASRSARGAPALEVKLHDPGPANGQMLLTTNEQGVVSWHFAPAPAGGSRGVGASANGGTRTYVVPRTVAPTPAGDGSRGLISFVGSKLFKELVFPLIDPALGAIGEAFAGRWEAKKRPYGLRTFTPDDYTRETGEPLTGDRWAELGKGRALLLVHGTFSRAHSAFGAMPRDFVETLHRQYEGRVFAFDHFTLSHDPKQNVNWFFDQMPGNANLDIDIVCHSRGGLVSRVLNEKQNELSLGSRTFRIGRIVFVGSPNAGTLLADGEHMGDFIDTYTNLLNFIPDAGVSDVIAGVVTVAKSLAVGAVGGLKGLQSMRPEGDFTKWLNAGDRAADTRYFALTSDYTPSKAGLVSVKNRLMDLIFKTPNDLVVPTDGVFADNGSAFFPIEDKFVFRGTDSLAHTEFFGNRAARDRILAWLTT